MKHRLLLLLMLVVPLAGWAQYDDPADTNDVVESYMIPDYDYLKRVVNDKTSKFYYPRLLKRFAAADTSLTLDEIHCLYYGSVVQPDYSPYESSKQEEKALDILNVEKVSKSDAKKAKKLLDKAISQTPMRLQLYAYRHYAETVLHGAESKEAANDAFRYMALITAIASSGNGQQFESAYHIAYTDHSYVLMGYFGFQVTDQSLMRHEGQHFDRFSLKDNDYGLESLFFNIEPCFSSLSGLFASFEQDESDDKPSADCIIALGSRVTLKLDKDSKGDFSYQVVGIDLIDDTIDLTDAKRLIPDSLEENTITICLVPGKWGSGSNNVVMVLMNNTGDDLEYDTAFQTISGGDYVPTSNSGMMSGVLMKEIWNDPIGTIRISNIRPANR